MIMEFRGGGVLFFGRVGQVRGHPIKSTFSIELVGQIDSNSELRFALKFSSEEAKVHSFLE